MSLRQIAEAIADETGTEHGEARPVTYTLAKLTLERLNAELETHDWGELEELDEDAT